MVTDSKIIANVIPHMIRALMLNKVKSKYPAVTLHCVVTYVYCKILLDCQ